SLQAKGLDSVTLKVVHEEIGRPVEARGAERGRGSFQRKPQEARAQLPIKEIVLKLVFVTTKTAIARAITVIGAVVEDPQRLLKDRELQLAHPFRETGATRQRIVDIDFRLSTFAPGGR